MRFLICGLGSIGRRHLSNLRSLGQDDLVLLRTRNSSLADEDLAGLPVESSIQGALARWHPDAVVVSNPTSLHLEAAIPSAQAGCHLLIEKPVSNSMEGIDSLLAAAERGRGRILVGYQFRFHPGLQKTRELLEAGSIGRPISARVDWGEYLPSWHPWEDYRKGYSAREDLGGGVLLTLCHPFDYMRWLLGEVTEVLAKTGKLGELGIEVEDTAEVILTHLGGAITSVHLDYLRRPACHRLEIVGTEGSLRWDNDDGVVHWWSAKDSAWQRHLPPEGFERNSMFLDEMRHFLDVIAGSAAPACTLQDGIKAMQIALSARQSHADLRKGSLAWTA